MSDSDNTLDLNQIRAANGDFDADFTAEEIAQRRPGTCLLYTSDAADE